MLQIGKYNDLQLTHFCDQGAMFDGGEEGLILMPRQYLKDWMEEGSIVQALVYPDTEDKLVATREKAYGQVGDFVFLQVDLVNEMGAYLDWGVARRLFVPLREQGARMQEDGTYLVQIRYNENTKRIYGTAKYDKFINKTQAPYQIGDEVEILIASKTDLGYKAIINNQYVGILYANELYDTLALGHTGVAYIKRIRADFKIDLSLSKIGFDRIVDFSEELLQRITERGGFLAVTDKSEAELIYEMFGVSKKTFKKAVGDLYRRQIITLSKEGIQLTVNS